MSIDTQVHGDPAAVSATGASLEEIADTLTTVAGEVGGLRADADSAWDGYRSEMVLRDFDTADDEISGFGEKVSALSTAVSTFASSLANVTEDMTGLRIEAIGHGLALTATTIEYPQPLGDDPSPEQSQDHGERIEAWRRLADRAGSYRSAEQSAHDTLGSAIEAFLSGGIVLDLLRDTGFLPNDTETGTVAGWLGSLGLRGTGWTSSWWTKVVSGRFAPRLPNGRFRAISDARWKDAWSSTQSRNWIAKPGQAATNSKWAAAGKWAGRVGTVVSFGTAAWGQWKADSDDPSLGWEEKTGRAATMGATTAAGGWAGAWAGGKVGGTIGFALGGPAGAVIGGAVGGVIGGLIGSNVGSKVGDALKKPVGKFVDAVSFWK